MAEGIHLCLATHLLFLVYVPGLDKEEGNKTDEEAQRTEELYLD